MKRMPLQLHRILREKLNSLKMGVPTLAKHTGISRQTISNWLEGQRPQKLEQVKAVADYLQMTLDQLCFDTPACGTVNQPAESSPNVFETHGTLIKAGIYEVVLRRVR